MTATLDAPPDVLAPIVDTAIALSAADVAGPVTAVVMALDAVERAAERGQPDAWAAWQVWQAGQTVDLAHGRDPRILELSRYVRTQAGARRFGQPVGSLITNKGRKSRAMTTGEKVRRATERRQRIQRRTAVAAPKLAGMDRATARTKLQQIKQPSLYLLRAELRRGTHPDDVRRKRHEAAIDLIDRELARRVDARVRGMDDATLERSMTRAIERNRVVEIDRYGAELDRRDSANARREESKAKAAAKREQTAAAREAERFAHYDRLIQAGYEDEDAVADAYGVSVDKQRARAALAQFRADGHQGAGLREAGRSAYRAELRERYVAAEDETRGHMLSKEGQAAGIDPASLFTGSDARARKYASEELRGWWDEHGRPTFDEFLAERLDPAGARRFRAARSDYVA